MKFMKNIIICILLACLLCSFTINTDAAESGTITVNLTYKNKPVVGGSILLYRVADKEHNLVKEFVSSGISLEDLESENTVKDLVSYVEHNAIVGEQYTTDDKGNIKTEGLDLGVYLIVEDQMPEMYTGFKPFLVTIPITIKGKKVYDVDATPKVDVKKDNKEPTTTTASRRPPSPKHNERLPQTGQLWWPVPILAFAGLVFFGYGWKRKRDEERG